MYYTGLAPSSCSKHLLHFYCWPAFPHKTRKPHKSISTDKSMHIRHFLTAALWATAAEASPLNTRNTTVGHGISGPLDTSTASITTSFSDNILGPAPPSTMGDGVASNIAARSLRIKRGLEMPNMKCCWVFALIVVIAMVILGGLVRSCESSRNGNRGPQTETTGESRATEPATSGQGRGPQDGDVGLGRQRQDTVEESRGTGPPPYES